MKPKTPRARRAPSPKDWTEEAASWVPIAELEPWDRNPKKNSHKIGEAVASLRTFGFGSAMVRDVDRKWLVGGNARLKGMSKILKEDPNLDGKSGKNPKLAKLNARLRASLRGPTVRHLPVRWMKFESEAHAEAYALRDNNQIGELDLDATVDMIARTSAAGIEVASLGFSEDILKELDKASSLRGGAAIEEDDDPAPNASDDLALKWGTAIGQLWEVGPHRLLCGNATSRDDVGRLFEGSARARLMNTDPPYGIAVAGLKDGMKGFTKMAADGELENDTLDGAHLQVFIESAIRAGVPNMTPDAAFYLWHPMLTQGTFFAAAAAADILIHRQIIWVKPSLVLTRSGMYHWKHELCFFGWVRGHKPPWFGEKDQTSVWHVGRDSDAGMHPTQKPIELFVRPILNHTQPDDVVYEPFSGSGSQLLAAHRTGRRCLAMDIDPRYVAVALERMRQAGVEPRLVS